MGIKTAGSGGMGIFDRDVKKSSSRIGKQASRLAKAKKGGAGIGGLLGAIAVPLLAVALAPVTGGASLVLGGTLGAAVGGGLGSLAGSKIGGATSGVDQGDIMGNKFFKKSSADIATGIAQAEFGDVLKGTISGAMNAGTYADMGKSAMSFGKSVKDIGLGSTLKGYGQGVLGKEGMVQGALKGGEGMPSILDITKKLGPEGPGNVVGGVGGAGGESLLGRVYGGADKFLGGALPGGQPMGEGYLGKGFGAMKGLLGHNQMSSPDSTNDVRENAMSSLGINLPGAGDTQLQNPFGSPEEVLQFQQQFNENSGGNLSEDGQWGPNTMAAYQQYMRDM
tara:strand:+ start:1051 stop:2058 length:1008 start_codon:yes stop_codon:yes gene_type:complete